MIGRLLAAVLACLALPPALAQESETFYATDPERWGRVLRVVEPEYPPAALAARRTGHVDVVGRVNPLRQLEEIEFVPDNPESAIFIEPLRKALPRWSFEPPLDANCQPTQERVMNRVWFELDGDKPKISVALRRSAATPPALRKPTMIPLRRVEPVYPGGMQRMGWQAVVYTRMDIDAEGNVSSLEANAFPRRPFVNLRPFEEEVKHALMQWKYPAAGPGDKATRKACWDVWFRLTDRPRESAF